MKNTQRTPLLLLLPGLLIMTATVLIPIVRTFGYSLEEYNLKEPAARRFIGLQNYLEVLGASDFHLALKNSLWIMLFVGIFTLIASLFVALLLNKRTKITPLLTAIAIIPWALPPLVNGMMWNFIFYPGYGLINRILIGAGLIEMPISFTNHPFLFLAVVSVAVSWRIVPFCSLLILSNLQSIPEDLYDAAKVDGASVWQSFRRITFPLILPSLSVVLVKILMAAMNIFDEVVAMVGFRLDSQTLLINNYLHTFSYLDFGYGSAITYVIMLLSAGISYMYIKDMTEG